MSGIASTTGVIYPESDGLPMADNTLQFHWIQLLSANLAALFRGRADVFVGGNLLWYPVENFPNIVQAPDVFVVFGRPPGYRGSYRQWEEDDVPMTVVFEIRSPNDGDALRQQKLDFYSTYNVAEYYHYDPDRNRLEPYIRRGGDLGPGRLRGRRFTSERLGIHFDLTGPDMVVCFPDGSPFRTLAELTELQEEESRLRREAETRALAEAQRADAEAHRAEEAAQRAILAEQARQRLAELMRRVRRGEATSNDLAELEQLLGGG